MARQISAYGYVWTPDQRRNRSIRCYCHLFVPSHIGWDGRSGLGVGGSVV